MAIFTLSFEPMDVLLFRDHRPFDAGQHAEARGRLPLPSVFRGALRTALLRAAGVDFSPASWRWFRDRPLHGWLGDPDTQGTLRLRGPVLGRGLHQPQPEPLYPAPADLAWPERVAPETCAPLGGLALAGVRATEGRVLPWSRTPDPKPKEPRGRWLTADALARWLSRPHGDQRNLADTMLKGAVAQECVCDVESRTGNARDPGARTVSDAMLYTLELWRFARGAGFLVEVEAKGPEELGALRALGGQTLQLGGKGHRARIRVHDGALVTAPFPTPSTPQVRAVLLTPMVAPRPGEGEATDWRLTPPEGATLRALVRPGAPPAPAGGFDMHRQAPKALHTTLPAGTVIELDGVVRPAELHAHTWGQEPEHFLAGHGAAIFGGMNP